MARLTADLRRYVPFARLDEFRLDEARLVGVKKPKEMRMTGARMAFFPFSQGRRNGPDLLARRRPGIAAAFDAP